MAETLSYPFDESPLTDVELRSIAAACRRGARLSGRIVAHMADQLAAAQRELAELRARPAAPESEGNSPKPEGNVSASPSMNRIPTGPITEAEAQADVITAAQRLIEEHRQDVVVLCQKNPPVGVDAAEAVVPRTMSAIEDLEGELTRLRLYTEPRR